MIDPDQARESRRPPDEAAELHRELASLRIRERASFGVELRAELEDEWARDPGPRRLFRSGWSRRGGALATAAVAALLILGLTAPQARAALSDVLGSVRAELARILEPPEPAFSIPHAGSVPPPLVESRPNGRTARPERPEDVASETEEMGGAAGIVLPDLLDRAEARQLVEGFYPRHMEDSGIGGTVGLRIFVEPDGTASEVQVMRSSGVRSLDSAAVEAAPHLRFKPALKGSSPVGTWVELGIDFSPRSDAANDPPPARAGGSPRAFP